MGLGDWMKNAMKKGSSVGEVSGSKFPLGTYINMGTDKDTAGDEKFMLFTYPDNTEEKITHDKIQCATVLAMGVIDIKKDANTTTLIYGTKYLCVLKDSRQAVLTVGLGESQYAVESVLF